MSELIVTYCFILTSWYAAVILVEELIAPGWLWRRSFWRQTSLVGQRIDWQTARPGISRSDCPCLASVGAWARGCQSDRQLCGGWPQVSRATTRQMSGEEDGSCVQSREADPGDADTGAEMEVWLQECDQSDTCERFFPSLSDGFNEISLHFWKIEIPKIINFKFQYFTEQTWH